MTADLLALLARPDLSPGARILAHAIAAKHGIGQPARLGMAALCSMAGLADRTCRRALRELGDAGVLDLAATGHGARLTITVRSLSAAEPAARSQAEEISAAAKPAAISAAKSDADAPSAAKLTADRAPSSISRLEKDSPSEKGKGKGRAKAQPTLIPADFTPSPGVLAHVAAHCPLVDVSRELSAFRLYWLEGRGAGKARSDWGMGFRLWCDKAQQWAGERGLSPGSAAPGGARAASPGPAPRESEGMRRLRQIAGQERDAA